MSWIPRQTLGPGRQRACYPDVHFCWGQHKGSVFCSFQSQRERKIDLCELCSWPVWHLTGNRSSAKEKPRVFGQDPKESFKLLISKPEDSVRVLTHPVNRSESFIPIRKTQEYFSKWGKNSKRRITAVLQPGWEAWPLLRATVGRWDQPSPTWAWERQERGCGMGWGVQRKEEKTRGKLVTLEVEKKMNVYWAPVYKLNIFM